MTSQLNFKGVVLKKTKLGESDLIVTFLAEDGSRMQAVARGARKPKSVFSTRLELFSCAELFCGATKGLPLVQEARLIDAHQCLREDFDQSTAASAVVELVLKSTHEDVPTSRLYALCNAALHAMESLSLNRLYQLSLAACLKVFALTGVRPSFAACAQCSKPLFEEEGDAAFVAFSSLEGGCLCNTCALSVETVQHQVSVFQWMNALLFSTFDQVNGMDVPVEVLSFGYHFVQDWAHVHLGAHLKSVPFLLVNATFSEQPC